MHKLFDSTADSYVRDEHTRSLMEIIVLLEKVRFDVDNMTAMKKHELF